MLNRSIGRLRAVVVVALMISACGGNEQAYTEAPPPDVDFAVVQAGTAETEKKYPGAIEGAVNVDIKAQATGYLDQIYVKEGDYVQKGQSLFRLKADAYTQQINNSEAAVQAALSAEENARLEVEKIKPLVEGEVVAELQLKTAEANYASAKAQVAQAKAALGSSQVSAGFTLIKAPVSGYIGRIPNRIGNLVTPADLSPLTTLSDINEVFVYFSLSEADFIAFVKDSKTDNGMNTVELIIADGSIYTHKGKVEVASGNIDRSTGSIPLKAVFSNPDKILRSGGMAKIVLKKTRNQALSIPMASVKDIQDKFFVFVLADSNKVNMRPIDIEGKSGTQYIVKAGLSSGDKIALNRIDVLTDGTVVQPTTLSASQNAVN